MGLNNLWWLSMRFQPVEVQAQVMLSNQPTSNCLKTARPSHPENYDLCDGTSALLEEEGGMLAKIT